MLFCVDWINSFSKTCFLIFFWILGHFYLFQNFLESLIPTFWNRNEEILFSEVSWSSFRDFQFSTFRILETLSFQIKNISFFYFWILEIGNSDFINIIWLVPDFWFLTFQISYFGNIILIYNTVLLSNFWLFLLENGNPTWFLDWLFVSRFSILDFQKSDMRDYEKWIFSNHVYCFAA